MGKSAGRCSTHHPARNLPSRLKAHGHVVPKTHINQQILSSSNENKEPKERNYGEQKLRAPPRTFEAPYSIHVLIFSLCLAMYLTITATNLLVLVTVTVSTDLHKPMHIFLCNLAIDDIIISTGGLPKQLQVLLTGNREILYVSCVAQMFTIHMSALNEIFTLAIMSVDRYLAICYPLHYNTKATAKRSIFIHPFAALVKDANSDGVNLRCAAQLVFLLSPIANVLIYCLRTLELRLAINTQFNKILRKCPRRSADPCVNRVPRCVARTSGSLARAASGRLALE
ncbi:olfactory receptor 10G6-like [Callorhinchus milii]|uniref:olfactory receptor 10G6-like n=1 Tax=Callorhinchus milii TaxID=7868 RepID=UPI001C3FF595|nr:olfactory receptor 10G6-like [Callorhinchus milii]